MNSSHNDLLPMLENPFYHRGPIRDRRYFYGRVKETSQALQMLRNGQCVSIVGPRRIGKTSFLFHLYDLEVQKGHNLKEEYLFIYIDCQSMGDLDKSQFYQQLWRETKKVFVEREREDGWTESVSGFNELSEAIEMIQKGHKLSFLFDEFDTIAKNPNLDQGLFSNLRSLVPDVTYATASHDSLYNLTYADGSVLSSPFFNIFEEIHPSFLKREEAEELVWGLLRITGQENLFTDEDLAFVFETSGCHPFFLQLACYHLFEQKVERKLLKAADYTRVQQEYAEDAEPHFRYAWKNLDADEQEALQRVYEGRGSQLDDEQKRRLERRCILFGDAFFSSVFAEFVRRQLTETSAGNINEGVQVVSTAAQTSTSEAEARRDLPWLRKAVVTLIVALFILSAVLAGPDLPDLAMKVLNVENVTSLRVQSARGEVMIKVYSPKLLLVGETALIKLQTDSSEKPAFKVTASPNSSDVVITKKEGAFEIECKGTSANMLSRSRPIALEIKATMPGRPPAAVAVTVKTNYLLSLLARVGLLLLSAGLSVKKLWEWLWVTGKGKQTPHSPEQIAQERDGVPTG